MFELTELLFVIPFVGVIRWGNGARSDGVVIRMQQLHCAGGAHSVTWQGNARMQLSRAGADWLFACQAVAVLRGVVSV